MKTIKRIFKLGHFLERSSPTSSTLPNSFYFQRAEVSAVFWLAAALLMAWVAFYSSEHLAVLYIAEPMSNIIDLDNGNFSVFDPYMLKQMSVLGNFESYPGTGGRALLAKSYAFMKNSILLLIFFTGLFATLGVCKVFCLVHFRYFSLAAKFRKALENNQLNLHYQPIVDIRTGVWVGAEALLRWSSNGRTINPQVFIPLIEQSGLMPLTTRWICQRVIEEHSNLIWACDDFYISINLSAQDVLDPTFADFIEHLLSLYKVPASRIVFEVTEGVVLDKPAAKVQLSRLRAQGHLIALDDFGTGYSSLSYLDCLPLDIIKIDRSFLARTDLSPTHSILSHVLEIARHLKFKVIVEGVETGAQVERLIALGAPTAQGWFYSRELPVTELVRRYFSLVHPDTNRVI